jgi:hypothetical protein
MIKSCFLHYVHRRLIMTDQGELRNVQVRLMSNSLESIDAIAKRLQTNKTQVVATSVQLTDMLTKELAQGGKMYVERPNGTKEHISFIGLKKE